MAAKLMDGFALAQALRGVWRTHATLPALPATTHAALCKAGCGGLVGRLLPMNCGRVWRPFRDEYRVLALHANRNERVTTNVYRVLEDAGTQPVFVKGLSVARHYPDAGCRPVGDIDICVRPGSLPTAMTALQEAGLPLDLLDLHEGCPDLPGASWDDLVQHTSAFSVNGLSVRILGAEDLLRLVCLHFVRHLGERPLWLCDVAVLLEHLPPTFDWDRCLRTPHAHARWVLAVIAMAGDLLGAVPALAPPRHATAPTWLKNAVLRRWGTWPYERRSWNTVNPIRAAWRVGLGPVRWVAIAHVGAALLRPAQIYTRLARLFQRKHTRPFSVHHVRRL